MSLPRTFSIASSAFKSSSRVPAASFPVAQQHNRHFSSTFRRLQQQGPPTPPRRQSSPLKIWPFLVILGVGSYAFYGLVQAQNAQPMPAVEAEKLPAPKRNKPLFTTDDATVIFVLGGPGAGKGTQCAKLVQDFGFKHLSAGDLLREEQDRPGSEFGELIKSYIRDGKIVPMEVTVQLLENAMNASIQGEKKNRFLIDGFPRKMDQALAFEDTVVPSKFTLFFDCPEEVMEKRLLNRGKTSGRADDNIESIKKRFKTFVETSKPVVDHFEEEGRVEKIKATRSPDEIYAEVKQRLSQRGIKA